MSPLEREQRKTLRQIADLMDCINATCAQLAAMRTELSNYHAALQQARSKLSRLQRAADLVAQL